MVERSAVLLSGAWVGFCWVVWVVLLSEIILKKKVVYIKCLKQYFNRESIALDVVNKFGKPSRLRFAGAYSSTRRAESNSLFSDFAPTVMRRQSRQSVTFDLFLTIMPSFTR